MTKYIKAVIKAMDEYCNSGRESVKASTEEIETFQEWVSQYYEKGIPEYIEFVKIANGFHCENISFYSLHPEAGLLNIYERNAEWWKEDDKRFQQYIFFADEDACICYGFNITNEKYYRIDPFDKNILDEYETFDDLITRMLKEDFWYSNSEEFQTIVKKYMEKMDGEFNVK
jgi:hypothetical protein